MFRLSLFAPPVQPVNVFPFKQIGYQQRAEMLIGDHRGAVSDEEKVASFTDALSFAHRLELGKPHFLRRNSLNSSNIPFTELFLSQGIIEERERCVFVRDSNGRPICYNLRAIKIRDFLSCTDFDRRETFTVLDPYSISPLYYKEVKKLYEGHPRYQEFINLKGFEANYD